MKPSYIDMTSRKLCDGSILVVSRIPYVPGESNAHWLCACLTCGNQFVKTGGWLRLADRRGQKLCKECRPKRDYQSHVVPLNRDGSPRKKHDMCKVCWELPHRRPRRGKCICGRRYAAERYERADVRRDERVWPEGM